MVISMVEGKVAQENQETLSRAYQDVLAEGLPQEILQTFLLRKTDDQSTWRIVTVWRSADALRAVRQAPEPPAAIRMFRAAGVEPRVDIFEVVHTEMAPHEAHGART